VLLPMARSHTAFDMETANRFGVPYIAVIATTRDEPDPLRPVAKYGRAAGNVGNLLGDVPFGKFAEMLAVTARSSRPRADRAGIERARESVHRLVNRCGQHLGDPREIRAGTKIRPCISD